MAGDRRAGPMGDARRALLGRGRAVDSRTAAPVAGVRMGGFGLAPEGRCGMVRLDPPGAAVRAGGPDHGGVGPHPVFPSRGWWAHIAVARTPGRPPPTEAHR